MKSERGFLEHGEVFGRRGVGRMHAMAAVRRLRPPECAQVSGANLAALVGVDVGGAFTDVVMVREGGFVTEAPSLPAQPERAVLEGAGRCGFEGAAIFKHASSNGLNGMLTRSLAKIGFLANDGRRDILDQGRAWRPMSCNYDPRPLCDRTGRPNPRPLGGDSNK